MNDLMKIGKKVRRNILLAWDDWKFRKKSRKETFSHIYAKKLWGGAGESFYSGTGSYEDCYVAPYCELIHAFISEHNIHRIVDLGCGDFQVASQWITEHVQYEGIDVVPELINYNIKKYGKENIHFQCLDIVEDKLPDGELCLIRQVLQHLSNSEILQILNKVKKYKYVIVTEHIRQKEYAHKYNVDKGHGARIRTLRQSGVYLDEAPFNVKVEKLMTLPYGSKDERQELVSVLIKN